MYQCNTDISVPEDFDPTKWDEVTIAEIMASQQSEISTLNASLTQLLPSMTLGSPVAIPWTNDKYTCPNAGVITGFIRKTANNTAGIFGLQSNLAGSFFRAIENLYTSQAYASVNMVVGKGEELTIQNKTEIGTITLYFVPFI